MKRILYLAAALVIAISGCSPAYHDYPCGCVPYAYCAPRPLPYATYAACPTPVASCYLRQHPAEPEPVAPVQATTAR